MKFNLKNLIYWGIISFFLIGMLSSSEKVMIIYLGILGILLLGCVVYLFLITVFDIDLLNLYKNKTSQKKGKEKKE